MDQPHVRLARFLKWKTDELKKTEGEKARASQEWLGREIGRTQSAASQILAGKKLPDRLTANAIERITTEWPEGPIRSEEWDAVEIARTGTEG